MKPQRDNEVIVSMTSRDFEALVECLSPTCEHFETSTL